MKLLKRVALLSLCALALSGCTKSSISTSAPVVQNQTDIDSKEIDNRVVEKAQLVEEDAEPEAMFDWEQVDEETEDLFSDVDLYPQGVEMSYECDEDAKTIKLMWVLKNGTSEEDAMSYATEMVQMFNDILAVQSTAFEFSDAKSFGTVWDQFALTVQVSTEDGTMMIDKNYAAGDIIDLKLPEYSGDGPQTGTEEKVSPQNPGTK